MIIITPGAASAEARAGPHLGLQITRAKVGWRSISIRASVSWWSIVNRAVTCKQYYVKLGVEEC